VNDYVKQNMQLVGLIQFDFLHHFANMGRHSGVVEREKITQRRNALRTAFDQLFFQKVDRLRVVVAQEAHDCFLLKHDCL
jgi:hypothetical protein